MKRLIVILVFFLMGNAVLAQQQNALVILSRNKQDGVWLRWAPTTPTFWQLGSKYGYNIERFTLTANGDMEPNSQVTLTKEPLRPYTQVQFLPLSEQSDEVATVEELLYGEDVNTSIPTHNTSGNVSSILTKNNELENRFGMVLLMCDLSIDAAKAAGLFFKDATAVKNKRYIYRFGIAYNSLSYPIEPTVSIVSVTEEKPLSTIKDLRIEFEDKKATLSWSTLLHKGEYSAYYIERSTDGKKFARLTDLPYVHMTETLNTETAYYVDSLENNQQKYHYRISGISPFAEVGAPSNIVSGQGKESLFGLLILREAKALDKTKVKLAWEFPKEAEDQLSGFIVSRANNPDGPFIDSQKKLLLKNIREHTDATTFNNTYYIVKAIDKTGAEITRSFPYLVQIEDNTPPAIPVAPTGNVNKNGVITLTWKANTDVDLMGYRIFRSNSISEEPVEITKDILSKPFFSDTINIRVLNKKAFYYLVSVDKNYNTSNYSLPFICSRPDIIPPTPPIITKTEVKKDSIILVWMNSTSDDVAKYELSRVERESKITRIIKTYYPSSLVEKYTDQSLTPGQSYFYKLTVFDSAGNTSESVSREIYFEPGYRKPIEDVKVIVDRTAKLVQLDWNNFEPSTKCIIYRKINNNPFSIYKTLDGNIESFTDKNISINNGYSYKIQPIYSKGIKAMVSEEIKVVY